MGSQHIQIGYGSDTRSKGRPKAYGRRKSGKLVTNGGFSGEVVSDFTSISEDEWIRIFGTNGMPKWKKELLEKNGKID